MNFIHLTRPCRWVSCQANEAADCQINLDSFSWSTYWNFMQYMKYVIYWLILIGHGPKIQGFLILKKNCTTHLFPFLMPGNCSGEASVAALPLAGLLSVGQVFDGWCISHPISSLQAPPQWKKFCPSTVWLVASFFFPSMDVGQAHVTVASDMI